MNITNRFVFLYLAVIEFIMMSKSKKKMPIMQIPKSPHAATPSVKKKLAFAFCVP